MRPGRVEVYRDAADRWRWRFVATNGRIVADSGHSYQAKASAVHGARTVCSTGYDVRVVEVDE